MKILVIFLLVIFNALKINSNSLTVVLDSKWSNTPLLAEASEYFASLSQEYFWKYVDLLNEHKNSLSLDNTEIKNYDIITKISKKLLTSGEFAILQLSLSLRIYSPSIEMNQQLDTDINCPNKLYVVRFGNKILCDINEIKEILKTDNSNNRETVPLYRIDKMFPVVDHVSSISKNAAIVILYGDLRDVEVYDIHNLLKQFASNNDSYYVFRHRIKISEGKARLSGYGVELAIKSTEYKAVDDTKIDGDSNSDSKLSKSDSNSTEEMDEVQGFIFSRLKQLHSEHGDNLDLFRQYLMKDDSEIRPLKAWEIQDLSLKASQLIVNGLESNQALEIMRDVSQNYPLRATFLATVPVKSTLQNEISSNQALLENTYGISAGSSQILFNGYVLNNELDIYEIVDLARREMNIMTRLFDFELKSDQISAITSVQYVSDMSDPSSPTSGKPQFLLDFRSAPVAYINNLEKDSRYSNWPRSLQDILTPTYPGVMRRIAKNLYNVIMVLDPALPESRDYVKFVEAFIIHNAPIRMGFLWAIDPTTDYKTNEGRALVRAFNFVASEKDSKLSALGFITDFYTSLEDDGEMSVPAIQEFLKSKHPDVDLDMVFGEKSDYDDNVKSSWHFLKESGIINVGRPFLLINGLLVDNKLLSEVGFEEIVVNNVLRSTIEIQKLVLENKLFDQIPFIDQIMSHDFVVQRLNEKILDIKNKRFVAFSKQVTKKEAESVSALSNDQISTLLSQNLKYFVKNDDTKSAYHISSWIFVDIEKESGRHLLSEALKWIQNSYNLRLAIVPNPELKNRNSNINKAFYMMLKKLSAPSAKEAIIALISNTNQTLQQNLEVFLANNPKIKSIIEGYENLPNDYLELEISFVKNVLKSDYGASMIVTNGKIMGPFDEEGSIMKNDFRLLERTCVGSYKILSKLKSLFGEGADKMSKISDLTMKIYATLIRDYELTGISNSNTGLLSLTKKIEISGLKEEHSVFSLMGHATKPAYEVVAILDPLSRTAQKLSQILLVLKKTLNLNVKIILNPRTKLSEAPLKSFYRYVLDPSPVIYEDDEGSTTKSNGRLSSPRGHFSHLPSQPLLTVGLEPIHNWLVEPIKSVYDLDNLRLADIPSHSAHAQFELEYLLLEGHCVDMSTGQPPRGLQFVLNHDSTNRTVADTIVMANLGYFQMKANPGAWNLKLREGKSHDIYDIIDHEFTDDDVKTSDVIAVLNSFRSKIIRVKVNKKPDKMNQQLLSESKLDEDTTSIWASISNAFGKNSKTESNETINIFSVASGHLYERFLRIMMISVLKHTKSPVKFWFLKNYLSPTFKQFIPHMAVKYGFQYDLVQYKWPRWLHEQTEKQRIIWGYKILFLDVLFPLNVSKIIFVDADQIVRTDLKELVDLDLEGAPYGYTPFCDSRREMDGFRFWKSGYWNMHLAGRPYHISALYVVDLNRFRLMAAGDRLRGQYHGLSQDPNSLSNLDQDLPNNMIHQVPIKSLPQEWLWCETWCSDAEKKRAKTIDLCNNPQTKEPKLSAAMRIVPEWKSYDEEIKSLWRQVYPDSKQQQATNQKSQESIDQSEQQKTDSNKDIPKSDPVSSHTEL